MERAQKDADTERLYEIHRHVRSSETDNMRAVLSQGKRAMPQPCISPLI